MRDASGSGHRSASLRSWLIAGAASLAWLAHGGPAAAIDPFFPTFGNQGIDVRHYEVRLDVDPKAQCVDGQAVLEITATRRLESFSLDLDRLKEIWRRLVEFITLGGVRIAHHHGLLAHSDGDVVLHALSDALLGAAALGDIGKHFPDTDPTFKGADSRVLLRHVVGLIHAKGWKVGNVDNTIVAQAPKMAPHIEAMRAVIAADLQIELDQVNVKATTTEKLGFTGREEGIAVHSVALLLRA